MVSLFIPPQGLFVTEKAVTVLEQFVQSTPGTSVSLIQQ